MAHQDVVPVEPGTEANWEQPPFSGAIAGGFVWGRGTMDTKGKLVGALRSGRAAARATASSRRARSISFFGHDEEVGGRDGALVIAKRWEADGKRFDWVLDEGGTIAVGIVPGVAAPVALIGIAEKGYVTLSLTASAEGGHSSMPPPHTAIGILAAGDRTRRGATRCPPRCAARRASSSPRSRPRWSSRCASSSRTRDLLEPLLLRALSGSPRSNATIRTTTAVTMVQGGVKENALPASARALVNFRILPGDTCRA